MNKCRICGYEANAKRYDAIEMMNGTRERFTYFECPECHCLQIENIPDDLEQYYGGDYYSYDFKYNCNSDVDRTEFDHTRILDIGCGAGAFLCQLYIWKFDNLTGCDPFIEEDIHYPNGINIYKKTIHEMEGKFDWIYMKDSYEHVTDPMEVMTSIKRLLAPGGTAAISLPVYPNIAFDMFGTSWYQLDAPRHIYLHSKQSMKYLTERCGLTIRKIRFDSNYGQITKSFLYTKGISLWKQTLEDVGKYFTPQDIKDLMKLSDDANEKEYGDHATFFVTHDDDYEKNELDDSRIDIDANKIAFIICSNNKQYLAECINYISMLEVPSGITVDIIGIDGAEDITAAYQQAMKESDARYKVYLHQDCFILNEDFISDCIRIFSINEEYGMIGVVGKRLRIKDAVYWDKWDVGSVDVCNSMDVHRVSLYTGAGVLEDVDAISGMIMITQYDVNWREDVIKGFEFYDISQSMEFHKAGYKVGVINQDTPWCYHDCGDFRLDNYDIARRNFCEIYSDMGFEYAVSEKPDSIELYKEKTEQAYSVLNILCEIDKCQEDREVLGFDFDNEDQNSLVEKYNYYKFLLVRLEYSKQIEDMKDIIDWIRKFESGVCEIGAIIINHSVIDKESTRGKLLKLINEYSCYPENTEDNSTEYSDEELEEAKTLSTEFYPLIKKINSLSSKKIDIIEMNFNMLRSYGMSMVSLVDMFKLIEYQDKAKYIRDLFRKMKNNEKLYGLFRKVETALIYMEEISGQIK